MIGFVFIWTVGFTFSNIFQCFPFSVNWDFAEHSPGNASGQCINVNRMAVAQAWSDVATNFVIILLPLGCVRLTSPTFHTRQLTTFLDMGASDAILEESRRVRCVPFGSSVGLPHLVSSVRTDALQNCGLRDRKACRL